MVVRYAHAAPESCSYCRGPPASDLVALCIRSCCCALNECFDFSTVVSVPSECVDNCTSVDTTGSESDARDNCRDQAARFESEDREGLAGKSALTGQICAFVGEVLPVARSCDPPLGDPGRDCDIGSLTVRGSSAACADAGCDWTSETRASPQTCRQSEGVLIECDDHRGSEEACNGKGTCRFIPAQYGTEPVLDTDMTKANEFCG